MRAFWRGDQPLHSHADWRGRLGKNSKQGTSAATLAAVWAGPVEVMGALRHQPALEGLRLTDFVVEAQSAIDEFSGPRNHDAVLVGVLPDGERVCICIEAKVKESFGPTVKQQAAAAKRATEDARDAGKKSNATARLNGLLGRFVGYPHTSSSLRWPGRHRFMTTVLDCEPRSMEGGPWCMDVSGAPWANGIKLYIARAVTDLRTSTLEAIPSKPAPGP